MAFTSIEIVHDEISDLFDSMVDADQLVTNLDRPPLSNELEGRSPVLSLHYDGSDITFLGANNNQLEHKFIATLFINREGHGGDNTETLFMQRLTTIIDKIRGAPAGTNYDSLWISGSIQPAFAEIEGFPYRVAEVPFTARSYESG